MSAETLYAAQGSRYNWKVTKPEGGVRYHVTKRTNANERKVGTVAGFNGLTTATDYANREAAKDKGKVGRLV